MVTLFIQKKNFINRGLFTPKSTLQLHLLLLFYFLSLSRFHSLVPSHIFIHSSQSSDSAIRISNIRLVLARSHPWQAEVSPPVVAAILRQRSLPSSLFPVYWRPPVVSCLVTTSAFQVTSLSLTLCFLHYCLLVRQPLPSPAHVNQFLFA